MPDTVSIMVELQTSDKPKDHDFLVAQACSCSTFNNTFLVLISTKLQEIVSEILSTISCFKYFCLLRCTLFYFIFMLRITVIEKKYAKTLLIMF